MSTFTVAENPEQFREDLGEWLETNAPNSLWHSVTSPFNGHWGGHGAEFESPDHESWFGICLDLGWTAPGWPVEVGGAGLSNAHVRVFQECLQKRGLPKPLVGFGLTMIGPILLAHGNDAQQALHLPKIVRGEIRWCQGYSEPDAGSDLANLRTRAVKDGTDFVVDGQKVWTSMADQSDWIFCLVRTNSEGKKQTGITFLLIDMATPGITVQPIRLISGASPFCEVFFEGVRVPEDQVVGEVDDGWRVAKALLAHERSMVGESIAAGGARQPILFSYDLKTHAIERIGLGDDGKLADPLLRDAIIRSEMEQEGMRQIVQQIGEALKAGDQPGAESSILKVVGTELNMRRWELAAQIAGPTGLGWEGEGYSDRDVAIARQWLRSRGNSIEGGSSEIQRNIIATRVLGLPRGG